MKSGTIAGSTLALLFSLLLPRTSLAQEETPGASATIEMPGLPSPDFNEPAMYLLLGAGTGIVVSPRSLATTNTPNSTGFNGRLGYVGRWVGGELQFEYLPSFDEESSRFGVPVVVDSYSTLVMTANFKIVFPTGRLEPYLVGGLGTSRVLQDPYLSPLFPLQTIRPDPHWDMAARGGGGLNIYIYEKVAFNAEISYVWTGIVNNQGRDYLSIAYGFLYKY